MPKMNDAEIEQAAKEMANALRHDGYEPEFEKLTVRGRRPTFRGRM
jgi:hypothetical protein